MEALFKGHLIEAGGCHYCRMHMATDMDGEWPEDRSFSQRLAKGGGVVKTTLWRVCGVISTIR